MPPRDAFVAKFGGVAEEDLDDAAAQEIVRRLRALVATWDPLIGAWTREYERLGLEDVRRV